MTNRADFAREATQPRSIVSTTRGNTMIRKLIGATVATLALAVSVLTPAPAGAATCVPIEPSASPAAKAPIKSSPWAYRHAHAWVYGDSITVQTWGNLHTTTRHLAVDARWGRNTASTVTNLGLDVHRFRRHLPDVVVMATGTNDLTNLNGFARQVRLARAVLPRRVRLVWVNVYVETTSAYNGADRILAGARGVTVLRWSRVNLPAPSRLLVDGMHVNGRGCDARNALIRHAL